MRSQRPHASRYRRRRIVLAASVVVVVGGIVLGVVLPGSSGPRTATAPTSTTLGASKQSTTTSTFLGSYGVEADWVVDQNKLPGTTAWEITDKAKSGTIAGFANLTYAAAGQLVSFYVSTTAPSFTVQAFRMGYYQGKGARLMWSSKTYAGAKQPTCPKSPQINMVSCDDWSRTFDLEIPKDFVQGDYLFKLTASTGAQSYVPLTVWDPTSTATYLVKNDVFTWEAWNPYGGFDFYQGEGPCTFGTTTTSYPVCNRARVVSYDRPYGYGEGAADFLVNEYPLIRFAEQHGLDVAYVTDVTVEQHPSILLDHKTVLSLGHDECWSYTEREAAVRAQAAGVNLVFFAASAVLRHVRLQSSSLGPDREVVDYRDSSEDPLDAKGDPLEVTGNTWSEAPSSWPENAFVGETYTGYLEPQAKRVPFVVYDAVPWLFRGTGLHTGSVIPGVLASDFDQFVPSEPHPADLEILGHSPLPTADVQTNAGSGHAYSDLTYYTDPTSQAGVFDSGTNNWIPELAPCNPGPLCRQRTIARITGNLLRIFGQGPAGRLEPSKANWQQLKG